MTTVYAFIAVADGEIDECSFFEDEDGAEERMRDWLFEVALGNDDIADPSFYSDEELEAHARHQSYQFWIESGEMR
jgi:hypothetical protein